jgi:hypothetical protein
MRARQERGKAGVRAARAPFAVLHACITALVVLSFLLLSAPVRADEVIDRVLAVAGGEVITLSDVRAARELGRVEADEAPDPIAAVLTQLVDRALVLAEVDRFAPPEPSSVAIDTAFDSVVARFPNVAAFDAALARLGIDRSYVRELLREDLRIRAYLNQRFTADTLDDQRRMVDDWVAGLRRRGDIVMVYQPAVSAPAPGTASPGRD